MLRVVDEFDDVETSAIGFHEVGLGAAAHFADQPAGDDGHDRWTGNR